MRRPRLRSRTAANVRAGLHDAVVPDSLAAEERARRMIQRAFDEREPVSMRPARRRRLVLALAAAGIVAAVALTPAGAHIRDWIDEAIDPGEPNARPLIEAIPGAGSILVESGDGAWVVSDGGVRDRLGDYERVTWSPNGLYVGAAQGRELTALTPQGEVRWALAAPSVIRAIDWSPDDGYRIAYVSGRELRIVAGDGTGDEALAPAAGSAAIAWRPDGDPDAISHELAHVSGRRVVMTNTDTGETVWRSVPISAPVETLQWSADGERLLVGLRGYNLLLDSSGQPLFKAVAAGSGAAALAPAGDVVAFVRATGSGGAELLVTPVDRPPRPRDVVYSTPVGAPLGPPVFSPDGQWVLVPWPRADQWLFVRPDDGRVAAVAGIAKQFDADNRGPAEFPRVAGWCC